MKKIIFAFAAVALLFACKAENKDEAKPKVPEGAVDLGIVMTREDGTTYNLYWAKSNLCENGLCANTDDYGDYFAWGETEDKTDYSWSTYKFGSSESGPFSKYNDTDKKTALDPEDDVAHVKLGGKWRMPTQEEWDALREQCKFGVYNGEVTGYLITGPNGNTILLPFPGFGDGSQREGVKDVGYYWSSSFSPEYPGYSASFFFSDNASNGRLTLERYYGCSVRPVSE